MNKPKFELHHVVIGLNELIQSLEADIKPRGFLDLERLRDVSVISGLKLAKELVLGLIEKNEANNG